MKLHVDEFGTGADVVLLHGMTTPQHMAPLAKRLASRWRVSLVHLPGYGRSDVLNPYSVETTHALVEDALLASGVREAHMIGFSNGAYRAIAHAIRRRISVRSIYSIGGFANLTDEESRGLAAHVPVILSGAELEPVFETVMLAEASRARPEAVADVRSWATATPRESFARDVEAWSAVPDLRPELAKLDVPIVARVGALDSACPRVRSERLVAAARNARLEVVEGVGHTLLAEDFEATLASIERHLASV